MRPPSNSGAAAGTRWDHVRLNRLTGSIPVAPVLALAGTAGDASQGKPGGALSSAAGLARHPAGLSLSDKSSATDLIRGSMVTAPRSEQDPEYRRELQPSRKRETKSAGAEENLGDLCAGP